MGKSASDGSIVASLRKSLSMMQLAISALPDPVAVVDSQGVLIWLNEAFEDLLGQPRLLLIGFPLVEVIESKLYKAESFDQSERLLHSESGEMRLALSCSASSAVQAASIRRFSVRWRAGKGESSTVVIFKDLAQEYEVRRLQHRSSSLEIEARTCTLTGLFNRVGFVEAFNSVDSRKICRCAVVFIDLDGFKFVNDSYGHALGDVVLRTVGRRVRSMIRDGDFAARLSGDEFAMVISLENPGSHKEVKLIAGRLLRALTKPIAVTAHESKILLKVGASAGVTFVEPDEDLSDVLHRADTAMYRSKSSDFESISIVERRLSESLDRCRVICAQVLSKAIRDCDMPLYLQPIYDINEGTIVAYEALMRPISSSGIPVPVSQLLDVASSSARLADLDRTVFYSAARLAEFDFFTETSVGLSINVSVASLNRPGFVADILCEFGRVDFAPDRLIIEVAESELISNLSRVRDSLLELRMAGCKVYLDDFGTGSTGFGQLIGLPVDGFKVDKHFLHQATRLAKAASVLSSIASLSRELQMDVVVEGVETGDQLNLVRTLELTQCQGYLLGFPQPPKFAAVRSFDVQGAESCPLSHARIVDNPFKLLSEFNFDTSG